MSTDAAPQAAKSERNDASPPANKPDKARRKSKRNKRDRNTTRGDSSKRKEVRQPSFDVDQLREIVGHPLWQAVHSAKVISCSDEVVIVEVSPEGHPALSAQVPKSDWGNKEPEVGEAISVRLGDPAPQAQESNGEGEATLPVASYRQAEELAALARVAQADADKATLTGIVVREVKGGYAVALGIASETELGQDGVVRAFLPKSQATYVRGSNETVVGVQDEFDIHELEADRANVVVSRKARMRVRHQEAVKELWENVEEGQVRPATVRSLMPYGAFVDLGGIDALLHVTDLTWDRPPPLREALSVGQVLDVKLLKVDKETKKIKVGVKQLEPDPWQDHKDLLAVDSTIEGQVVAVTDFGVFVRVADGVEGLAHLSELGWERIKHPSQKFSIGQDVRAKILEVDIDGRRLSLSLRALEDNPFEVIRQQFPEGTVVRAAVKSLTDFGAFVALSDTVDGMIHLGELSWMEHHEHPSEVLSVGQEVECVVTSVDVDKQRVACSIKRLEENPWERWERTFEPKSRHTLEISRVVDHGVFFVLEDGLTGFCPTRELSSDALGRAQEVAKPGDSLEVEVRIFDRKNRRVTFSAKAIVEEATREAYAEYKQRESDGDDRLTLGDAIKDKLPQMSDASEEAKVAAAPAEAADDETAAAEAAQKTED